MAITFESLKGTGFSPYMGQPKIYWALAPEAGLAGLRACHFDRIGATFMAESKTNPKEGYPSGAKARQILR
jgi:hypothetical protein